MPDIFIKKIISGGQTGVDRAALDFAIENNIPHGGWCPKGRIAEDGTIAERYQLQETPSSIYSERTLWNVRDSDATLIITLDEPYGGTLMTQQFAEQLYRPYFVFDFNKNSDPLEIHDWLMNNEIKLLNIAGPRASKFPQIYQLTYDLLKKIFKGK